VLLCASLRAGGGVDDSRKFYSICCLWKYVSPGEPDSTLFSQTSLFDINVIWATSLHKRPCSIFTSYGLIPDYTLFVKIKWSWFYRRNVFSQKVFTNVSLFDINVIMVQRLHFVCENKVELVLPTKRIFTKSFHKRPCSIFTSYGSIPDSTLFVKIKWSWFYRRNVFSQKVYTNVLVRYQRHMGHFITQTSLLRSYVNLCSVMKWPIWRQYRRGFVKIKWRWFYEPPKRIFTNN
jgi:hypothetical protein